MKNSFFNKAFSTTKCLMLAGAGTLLVGCSGSEDLSDRPFVMACTGENALASQLHALGPNAPSNLSGVDLPDEVALGGDGGVVVLYRDNGFLPHETSLKGNRATIPLVTLLGEQHVFADTGKSYWIPNAYSGSVELVDPVGELHAAHFYIDDIGNLIEIDNFHIAKYSTPPWGQPSVIRTAAAIIPPNATYAVVHIEASTEPYREIGQTEATARIGQSGYWVLPLEDKYRYQPFSIDEKHGEIGVDRPLAPYLGPNLVVADNDTASIGVNKGRTNPMAFHRRAHSGLATIGCLMSLGDALRFEYVFDVRNGVDSNGVYPARGNAPSGYDFKINDYYFVGGIEALNELPRDPSKFKG